MVILLSKLTCYVVMTWLSVCACMLILKNGLLAKACSELISWGWGWGWGEGHHNHSEAITVNRKCSV